MIGFVILADVPSFFFETKLYGFLIRVKVPDFIALLSDSMLIEDDFGDFDSFFVDLELYGFILFFIILS
jgi:hypothetical protein